MKLLKTALIAILFCLTGIATKAQDTVYIYEEVIVYDTIYEIIEKRTNPFDGVETMRIIQIDTLTNTTNLLIIGNGQSTSIPIDKVIISDDVKKNDSTNNMGFFDLMLFAAKNMLIEKSTIDMFLGAGAWTSVCTPLFVENHLAWNSGGNGTLNFGVNYETKFISRFTLGTGAHIHFLFENEGLKGKFTCDYPDCGYCEDDPDIKFNIGRIYLKNEHVGQAAGYDMHWDENESTGSYSDSVGIKESITKYVLFAVPVRVGYQIGKFTPYLGVEYNIRMAMSEDLKDLHSLGFITGMRYDASKHFAVSSNFYTGLTKDMSHRGTLYSRSDGTAVRTDTYNWHSFRFEITGHFKF
ncbi:MAG: hypothetical protein J5651_06120 [Salinivirgaceae bacterium]|nr:hypothetical protein [Salinivirgaceae bacterium]